MLKMRLIMIIFCTCWYMYQREEIVAASISFFDTQRPAITFVNTSYVRYAIMTSRRPGRQDPRHYTSLSIETLVPLGNNLTVHFYFYQLLTNRYRPSFVELHYGICDMIEKDSILGSQLKKHVDKLNVTCPYPAREYNFTDMVIPFVPKNFPFTQGRIYLNATFESGRILMMSAYMDMEIKQIYSNTKKH